MPLGRHGKLSKYGQLASTSVAGPSHTDLLIIEKGAADFEFDVEGAKYLMSRKLSRDDMEALQVLEKKFEIFNEVLETDPDPSVMPFQKRFFIAWSDALAYTHYRLGSTPTPIPLAATAIMSAKLSKWTRLGRWLKLMICCNRYEKVYERNCLKNKDYTKPESRERFELIMKKEMYPEDPKLPPHKMDRQARRFKFFDIFAPKYFHKIELPKFFRRDSV